MPYILVKNHENLTKTKEVTAFYSLKPEASGKTPACYNILLSVNSFTVATNHVRIQKFSSGGVHVSMTKKKLRRCFFFGFLVLSLF